MKKGTRSLMLLSSLVLFVIAAPLIIFYAMGYRLRPPGESGPAVGVVLLDAIPRGVEVYVNDAYVGRTPEAIANLLVDSLRVRVSKTGYSFWEKTLPVTQGRATEARDIRLFPSDPAREVLVEDVAMYAVAPSRRLIAVLTASRQLSIIDREGVTIARPVTLSALPAKLLWSPDSSYVLVDNSQASMRLLSIASGEVRTLGLVTNARDVTWDPRVPGRLLYIDKENILTAHNVVSDAVEFLVKDVKTFATSNRHVFIVDSKQNITTYNFSGQTARTIKPLGQEVARLYVTPQGSIAVQLADNSLFLMDDAGEWTKVSEAVVSAGWSPNGRMLYVLADTNTLFVYNVDDDLWQLSRGNLQLVQRLSRPITNVQWFAGGRHLLYQIDDTLIITEIDTRDHPITYQLDSVNLGDAQAAVGEDGETVYYLKRQQDISSLTAASMIVKE